MLTKFLSESLKLVCIFDVDLKSTLKNSS